MFTRTKVICTLGPAVDSYEKIYALAQAGMDVARINFSHGTHEEHLQRIEHVKKARQELNRPIAIMLDTKGPEIRIGQLADGSIELKKGQKVTLGEKGDGTDGRIPIHPVSVLDPITKGTKILFNDGYIVSHVIEKKEKEVVVEVHNDGLLASRKGVNIPHAHLNLPAMTEEDKEDILFGCKHDVDIIAASFIRSSEHVLEIKSLLSEANKPETLVIAKIENNQGVEHFDTIVGVADGIMIARGDLGVELELSTIPKLQKMMIRKCYEASKPVVTATQMLESMIVSPRPTRAEVSDVANAIYDSTSAVMLSAETAVGKYPVESLICMKDIIKEAESDFSYREFFDHHSRKEYHNVSSSVALAAVKTCYSAKAKAIFAFTTSGFTARIVSRFRPEAPIIAVTTSEKNYHQLAFNWGVFPTFDENFTNVEEAFTIAEQFALDHHFVSFGDLVAITAGSHFGKKGSTNMLMIESIGNVLIRGEKGCGEKIDGVIHIVVSPTKEKKEYEQDTLVVLPRCDQSYIEIVKHAKGIILDNHVDDIESEKYAITLAKTFNLSVVVRAENATQILEEGQKVTMDPQKGVVYSGRESNK